MTLRLGLVGGGWISRQHLEALKRLDRTELVGVVAGSRETADAVAAEWGGRGHDDLDQMLDDARPDVVYVAVPPHRAVAIGETLIHEIGHYFGLSEEQIEEIEDKYWRGEPLDDV